MDEQHEEDSRRQAAQDGSDVNTPDQIDSPDEIDNKQLDPDLRTLFENDHPEHFRRQDQVYADGASSPAVAGRIPPMPSRYYSQNSNKHADRRESASSNASSEGESSVQSQRPSSADSHVSGASFIQFEQPDSAHSSPSGSGGRFIHVVNSNESSGTVPDIDAGRLFQHSTPELANSLASRRAGNRFAPLGVFTDNLHVPESTDEVSSATFKKLLQESVPDPAKLEKLVRGFDEVNDAKNQLAMDLMSHYKRVAADNEKLAGEYYARHHGADERKRIKPERKMLEQKVEKAKRERIEQMDKNENSIRMRQLAMQEGREDGWWYDSRGNLRSPESEGSFDDGRDSDQGGEILADVWPGEEAEDEEDGQTMGSRDFYSDETDPRDRPQEPEQRTWSDDDWPGDVESRRPLTGSKAGPTHSRRQTRDSLLSLDKPLPAIPDEQAANTIRDMKVLLQLLPVKIALIEQTSTRVLDKKKIYAVCESATELCHDAGVKEASSILQGRCAFYMGLAEYLRGQVDDDPEKARPVATACFESAAQLCGEDEEEGVWGGEWMRTLKEPDDEPSADTDQPQAAERTGSGEGLVGKLWDLLKGSLSGSSAAPRPLDVKKKVKRNRSSGSSSFGGRFAAGKGQKLQRPEDIVTDAEEDQVPNSVFGGMVPIADLPQAPPKKPKTPVTLGRLDTEGQPDEEAKNTILSPSEGIFASPERYANGFTKPPTTPTIDRILDAGVYSPDPGTSPKTEIPPSKRPGLVLRNPDPASTNTSTESKRASSSYISSLGRRLSAAISPSSDASAPRSPESNTLAEEHASPDKAPSDSSSDDDNNNGKPLSLAERRRQSSVARFSMFLQGGAPRGQPNPLSVAEEGDSPKLRTSFEGHEGAAVARASGSAAAATKKSPLGSPDGFGGEAEGMRRRRRSGERGEDMV